MLKRKFLAWMLTFVLVLGLCSGAVAAAQSNEGVEVTLSAAKSSYAKGEDIKVALSVKNTGGVPVTDLVARLAAPSGYSIEGSGIYSVPLLGAGESASYDGVFKAGSGAPPATGDDSHTGLWMCLMLASLAGMAVVCIRSRRARRVLAVVLCVASLAGALQPAAALADDGVTTMADFPQKLKVYARSASRAVSMDVAETVNVAGAQVTLSVHVEFSLPSGDDNLMDDIIDLGDLEMMELEGKIEVLFEESDPTFIDGPFTDQKIRSAADAAEVLNNAADLFGNRFHASEENITAVELTDAEGGSETFYRYAPTVSGVKVLGGQIVLGADENGTAVMLANTYDERVESVDTSADISAARAVDIALDAWLDEHMEELVETYSDRTSAQLAADLKASVDTSSELLIYAASDDKDVSLVYSVVISERTDGTAVIPMMVDETFYIYANGSRCGTVHSRQENLQTELFWSTETVRATGLNDKSFTITVQEKDNVYRLNDTIRDIHTYRGVYTLDSAGRMIGSPSWTGTYVSSSNLNSNPSQSTRIGISGHANMAKVFDYYKDELGRDSFNNWSATVKVVTNAAFQLSDGTWYTDNACWRPSGKLLMFGTTRTAALDTVAHEFTHAVTQYVNGLIYSDESGALNEAYSDIMGSLIENKGSGRWTHGEDGPNGIVRSLEDPSDYGQPEHYNNYRYRGQSYDNGGVHINSGIINYAAYRMMTSRTLSGVSYDTWAKIFYDSMHRLSDDATFLQMRGAVICAARKYGFTVEQLDAVRKAFNDVGVRESDRIRIVLTWGENPWDLDSHLVGPGASWNKGRFHVYYAQPIYYADGSYNSDDSIYMAELDYDDVTSYGPEITTIHQLANGEYREGDYYFYVHDYTNGYNSNSSEMAASGATVKIYKGDSGTPINTFTITPGRTGTFWEVCKLHISSAGVVTVTRLNNYGNSTTLR